MGEIASPSYLKMPLVLVIGNVHSVHENFDTLRKVLLEDFSQCVSLREERRGELIGLYWYLSSEYSRLPEDFLREKILTLRKKLDPYSCDVLYLDSLLNPDLPSLFVFDMDSTMIREEVIDELARLHGVYDLVSQVTQEAMEGGLGFEDSLKRRVKYLTGLSEDSWEFLYQNLNLNPGVAEVLSGLKSEYKAKRAVLSGGFLPILQRFSKEYDLDFIAANEMIVQSGKFTGEIRGSILGREKKRDLLVELSEKWKIPPHQVVAVGDGANDLLMLRQAGIGIGFHAKEGLKKNILNWIEHSPLTALFLLFAPSL